MDLCALSYCHHRMDLYAFFIIVDVYGLDGLLGFGLLFPKDHVSVGMYLKTSLFVYLLQASIMMSLLLQRSPKILCMWPLSWRFPSCKHTTPSPFLEVSFDGGDHIVYGEITHETAPWTLSGLTTRFLAPIKEGAKMSLQLLG